jgi:Glycosyl hydrolase family 26
MAASPARDRSPCPQQPPQSSNRPQQSRASSLSVLVAAAVIAASGVYLASGGGGSASAAPQAGAAATDPLPPVTGSPNSVAGSVSGMLGASSPSDGGTAPAAPPSSAAPSTSTSPARVSPSAIPAPQPSASPSPSDPRSGSGGGTSGSGGCALTAKLVPTCSGALWGMAYAANGVSAVEQKIGRPLTVVKEYHDFSGQGSAGQFPTAAEQQLMNSGHILHFAWTAKLWSNQQATPSWKDIAAGKDDSSVVIPEAKRLAAVQAPFFIDWDHEMDGKIRSTWGTAADYVAAYRHIHAVFAQYGVTKAVWAWVPTGYSGNWSKLAPYYPGNDVVDWIGWDPYNTSVKNWLSPQQVFSSFYDWLDAGNLGSAAAAKPRMLGEYGTVADPNNPDRRAQWLSRVPAALSALPKLRAVEYWNQDEFALDGNDYPGYTQAGHSSMAQMTG